MKKRMKGMGWLSLLLLALLAGCSQTAPSAPQKEPETPDALHYELHTEEQSQKQTAEDGTELLTTCFKIPVLNVVSNGQTVKTARSEIESQALQAADTFNRQFQDWLTSSEMEETLSFAQQDWESRQEEGIDWTSAYTLTFAYTAYQTEHLISINGTYDSYTGGAHPNSAQMAWNFDLESGTFFTPVVLAADSQEFTEAVTQELIRQAQRMAEQEKMAADELFWADYPEILADWSSYAVSFDETGMTVSYSPYELAAYAAGTQVFRLTYDQITPYLSDHGLEVLGLQPAES